MQNAKQKKKKGVIPGDGLHDPTPATAIHNSSARANSYTVNFLFLSLAPWVQQSHEHVTPSVRWSFTQPNLSTGDMKKKKTCFSNSTLPGQNRGGKNGVEMPSGHIGKR